MFYDKRMLLTLAAAVGVPVKVDLNTLNVRSKKFALRLNLPHQYQ